MKNAFFNRVKFVFLSLMCIFCSIFFFACENFTSSDNYEPKNDEKLYELKGAFFVNGSSPKIFENTNQARSVSAEIPGAIFYAVIAKNAGNSEKSYTAEVDGSAFSIKLSKGTWNIMAEGFSDSEKTVSVLKGSVSVSVEDENSVKSGISIKMLPQTDGKGNISLLVEAEDGSGIKSVLAELVKNDEGGSVYSERLNFSGNAAKIEKSEISSGVYLLSLKFYSEDSGSGELLYTAQEVVNVFNNLTTDTWNGNSVSINGGKFFLSKSAVESFKMSTFFVQGESEATYSPVASADDSNAGTYFAPLATVQAAVDKISAINDGATAYTIYVDGTVTADSNRNYSENNSSFVNISLASTLNLTIKSLSSEKSVVDAGQNAGSAGWRAFYIGANAKVAFENITVTGGSLDSSGGGIYCDGNLSLRNCTVNGNINYNDGNLTLEGAISIENSIKISAGLAIGIKNLASEKSIKLSGKTEIEEWNVGTEVIYSADGTLLSSLICSKFSVQNKTADKKVLCIVPSSTDATKGVLDLAGVSVNPTFEQPEYTLALSPVLFSSAKADNRISLAVTDSDGNSVTPDSVEFALYQNKNKVAVLQGGLLPSWIPEGKYTVIATAEVGGYFYDAETNIIVSESIAISNFSSAPSAGDFPKLTAVSSSDMTKLAEWVKAGSDMEGITITLADDLDMSGCADFYCMGVTKADSTGDIQGNAFKGVFDGDGHSITLAITPTDPQPMGLFWQNDGTIMNLTIMQYSSTGQVGSKQSLNLSRGGVICSVNNGTIKNCVVKASVTSWSVAEIAGIARENSSSGKIVNCLVAGDITMKCDASNWADDYGKSSGIAAVNSGSIENCVYTGKITTKKVTDSSTYLSNISGAISAYTEGSIANCYWLKDCIDRGGTAVNQVAYINKESGGYGKICIAYPEKITGCGYFDTNSPTSSVAAGTTSECKSAQTLAYSGTLIDMLNAYVSASSDSGLKKWKADSSGNLTIGF